MTRIFDALKKAEASRQGPAHAPAPVTPLPPPPSAHGLGVRSIGRPAEPWVAALPLRGAAPMPADVLREMMALRVSLEVTLRDRSPRIVMFTSPQGGEGTTTVAMQFAQLLARDGALRPLLVDVHVNRPAFTVEPGSRAVVAAAQLLDAPAGGETVPTENLLVAPVPEEHRRSGLYSTAALRQMLDQSAAGFDWIVLDGPPVLDSPDAVAIGAIADGVVLVVQAGRSKRPVLSRAADLLRKAGAHVLGSVLNRRVLEIPEFIYRRI
jgi:Mrp family chromosome partitioning ATPase